MVLWAALAGALLTRGAAPGPGHTLKVIVQSGYLPQLPAVIRVELLGADGQPDRTVWDAEAILTESASGITLSTNRIALRNGLGTAPVTITGSGDFQLQVAVGPLQVARDLRDRSTDSVTRVGGALPGSATTWNGVVIVTNDLTVPSGHVLTIESNTLVLINGVASGTVASDLLIAGSIQSLGTESHPVTITCANAGLRWGQIRHNTAQPSLYRYTTIARAGRAPREGHTTTGPAIRPTNSRIEFESCTISDHSDGTTGEPGKIMQASGSDLVFNNTVLARARMGPEIAGTALLVTNSYVMEMFGPDDADGIYIHDAGSQIATLINSVFAFGHDDAIDTLGSLVNVENCILRNWLHPTEDSKGISVFNRTVNVKRCLIVDCLVGVSAKWNSGSPTTVFIQESTIIGTSNSMAANYKSNAQGPYVDLRITNSIITGVDPIKSDFGTTNFTIGYCVLGEAWEGTNNIVADPLFINAANDDYHLQIGSPCIDSGDPGAPMDADGSRIDIGCFTFDVPQPILSAPHRLTDGSFEFIFSGYTNRNYAVEVSTNAQTWGTLRTISHSEDPETIRDMSGDSGMRIYRARLTP